MFFAWSACPFFDHEQYIHVHVLNWCHGGIRKYCLSSTNVYQDEVLWYSHDIPSLWRTRAWHFKNRKSQPLLALNPVTVDSAFALTLIIAWETEVVTTRIHDPAKERLFHILTQCFTSCATQSLPLTLARLLQGNKLFFLPAPHSYLFCIHVEVPCSSHLWLLSRTFDSFKTYVSTSQWLGTLHMFILCNRNVHAQWKARFLNPRLQFKTWPLLTIFNYVLSASIWGRPLYEEIQ